jgi:methylase of polypeptide subunit release factors
MLSRMKFEIELLVAEMLDQLPEDVWTSDSTTFFDPAIGGGQFVRAIEQRLRECGHSDVNIRGRVFGFEESNLHIRFAVNKYNLVGQYVRKPYEKFFELDNTMKFDVVVGNPPYQNKEENADGALWLRFVNKGMEHLAQDGKLMFITPTSWVGKQSNTKKADWSSFTDNHVELYKVLNKAEKEKHFGGVGSSFGYYILSKGKGLTKIVFEDGTTSNYQLVPKEPLPNTITKTSFSIHQKIANVKKLQFESSFKFHSQVLKQKGIVSDVKGGVFKHTTYFSHNLIRYTSEKQDIYADIKVMIPNVGTIANAWVGSNCNLTEDVTFVKVNSVQEGDNLVLILKSKMFLYIGNQYRSGRNLGLAIKFLPLLDMSKQWLDSEIYKHFNLTQEEIDYVEDNVK